MKDIYAPKGRMCLNCIKRFNDCSTLPFETMKVIVINNGIHYVKCTDYEYEWLRHNANIV